jgi:hypothetical protein
MDSDPGVFAIRTAPGGTGALASSHRASALARLLLLASVGPPDVGCAMVRAGPAAGTGRPARSEPQPAAATTPAW